MKHHIGRNIGNRKLYIVLGLSMGLLLTSVEALSSTRANSYLTLNGGSLNGNYISAYGIPYYVQGSLSASTSSSDINHRFPLNYATDTVIRTPDTFPDARLWAYANEKGSVHTALDGRGWSIIGRSLPREFWSRFVDYDLLDVELNWFWDFALDTAAPSQRVGFTLNPGFIEHRIYSTYGSNIQHPPITGSEFEVSLMNTYLWERPCTKDQQSTCQYWSELEVDQFYSVAQLSGFIHRDVGSTSYFCESMVCDNIVSEDPVWSTDQLEQSYYGIRWDSSGYKGELATTGQDAAYGRVEYYLNLYGVASNDGRGSQAKLSDPLDPFDPLNPVNSPELETVGLIPDDSAEKNRCRKIPPSDRYRINDDGTVHDNFTGLLWQRCPVNYTLSTGVAGDISDDRCIADNPGSETLDWTQALQSAADSNLANHNDWRLPNAKQLESLISPCEPAAIDYIAFPDTPAERHWSSTPTRSGQAWSVNFANGAIKPNDTSSPVYARLMRVTNEPAVAPKPSLSAGFGRTTEGDGGTNTTLSLPITLSRPSTTDVTVNYEISSGSAEAGVDFIAHSGMATIPAGSVGTQLDVEVIGDSEPERHEFFLLRLSNLSGDVSMANHVSLGRIVDNDRAYLGMPENIQLGEGDAGSFETFDLPVTLSQPAKQPVSVSYASRDDTAVAGTDFLALNGTLYFDVGEQVKIITLTSIGNDVGQNDRNFFVDLSNPVNAEFKNGFDPAEIAVRLVDDDGTSHYTALNDTGYTYCADTNNTWLSCPQAGYPNQDGDLGRDVTHNDDSDGRDGFSFTKLDSSGAALVDQTLDYSTAPWDCVRDEVTGLYWEVKTPRTDSSNLRSAGQTFTWYRTDIAFGTENGGVCADGLSCDTEKYVAAMNAANLCGFNDWRLPTVNEAFSIAIVGSTLAPDRLYFPNLGVDSWTSEMVLDELPTVNALWRIYSYGMRQQPHGDASVVRLVRGGQTP